MSALQTKKMDFRPRPSHPGLKIEGYVDYARKKGIRWYKVNIVDAIGKPRGKICIERRLVDHLLILADYSNELQQLERMQRELNYTIKRASKEQAVIKKDAKKKLQRVNAKLRQLKSVHREDINQVLKGQKIRLHLGHKAF